jgi:hypothetical protein
MEAIAFQNPTNLLVCFPLFQELHADDVSVRLPNPIRISLICPPPLDLSGAVGHGVCERDVIGAVAVKVSFKKK